MFFVFNPRAGKAKIKTHLVGIVDTFTKAGYEVTIYPTQYQGDAIRATRERGVGYDMIVCSGGDGTLDEVVTGMVQSKEILPLGYVPAGSTNDFANTLKLPKNMMKAASVAVNGKEFSCDVGKFNQDMFVYIAAFGLFTDVSYGTGQEMKNLFGHMAYVLEGIKRISSIKSYNMRFSYNDIVITGDFIYGMITNSMSVGGFKGITGEFIELDDGEFEITLIKKPTSPIELNEIVAALLNKEYATNMLFSFKTSKIQVESESLVAWTLDGEFGGEHKEVVIENKKRALPIIVNSSFTSGKNKK